MANMTSSISDSFFIFNFSFSVTAVDLWKSRICHLAIIHLVHLRLLHTCSYLVEAPDNIKYGVDTSEDSATDGLKFYSISRSVGQDI